MGVRFKELLSVQQEIIYIERKRAAGGQKAQDERMVKRRRLEHVAVSPGDNVTIHIPLADHVKGIHVTSWV